ncbi:hypothetical protein Tco_0922197 [Tanacetum coccineum]|uniref:Uncharacterized protein n=1 Tax=Tanacetum coccineum TaxID=301880 RepID=A0ABQ5CYG6_9ASTR
MIVSHYMTEHPNISRRVHENYHRVENDDLVKNIFNSRKNKEGAGMKIPKWMMTEEIKQIDRYLMYATLFRVDVPTTQSQPIESTQGTHMTTSTPRTPNPVTTEGESSAQRKPIVIRFRIPRRPDPEMPIPTAAEVDITKFDETIQISIATQRSLEDLEAQHNVEQIKEHMVDEELDELLEGTKNVNVDEFMDDILNSQEDPDNRIYPKSYKESPEAKKSVDMMTIHFDEVEEESAGDEFKLKRREKGKGIEETRDIPSLTPIRSPRTHNAPLSSDKETLQELTVTTEDTTFLLYVAEGLLLDKQKTQADVAAMITEDVQKERENLRVEICKLIMALLIVFIRRSSVSTVFNDDISIWWSLKIKFERLAAPIATPCKTAAICPRDHDDHHDDAHPEGENNAKRLKTSKHEIQPDNPITRTDNTLTQEQLDEFDAWMDGFGTDDDEVPTEKVSPELMEEISEEIDEAQLKKVVDDMLRQRCNSREEHQYHVDQMQNYLKNDIFWESMKERLSLPTPKKPTSVYHSCQRDPKAPPMTLQNQDLFYLKHGNSGTKKYTLSLHKYLVVSFPDDAREEQTSRWVSKRPRKFNLYARYGVEH